MRQTITLSFVGANMKFKLITLAVGLLMIASGNAYSGLEELTLKDCKNKEESRLCVECGEDIDTLKFTLNNKISAVKVTFLDSLIPHTSVVFYKCEIFGDDNWRCVDESSPPQGKYELSNGIYFTEDHWGEYKKGVDGRILWQYNRYQCYK